MSKSQKVFLSAIIALAMVSGPAANVSAKAPDAVKYSSCAKLLKKYKNGIATSKSKKGKTKSFVNASLYRANKKWDVNKNGIVCDAGDLPKPVSWAPLEYSGSGSFVQEVNIPSGQPAIIYITHSGESNFSVSSLDKDLKQLDLLVNEIGNYQGTVFVDRGYSFMPTNAKFLEIDADGSWTMKISPATSAELYSGSVSGMGDHVLRYSGPRTVVNISHDGESNFSVITFDSKGLYGSLVVNEIGAFAGKKVLPSATYIAINADGNWRISK